MESAVSFAPLRPASFVNFTGRGGAACFSAGRGEHPCYLPTSIRTARNHEITARNRGTFTFDTHQATLETCYLWNIWSEWWGDMTWPKNFLSTFSTFFQKNFNFFLTFFQLFFLQPDTWQLLTIVTYMTVVTINYKFNNVHNKKTTIATKTMTKTILGLVTFETL